MGVVVNVNQVLDNIHPAHSVAVRKICPYPGLDSAIKLLHHGRLLFAFTGKVLNTVVLHKGLEVRVEELLALVSLLAPWVARVRGLERLVERRGYCFGVFGVDRNHPGKLRKYVNYGEQIPHSAVLSSDTLHIGQIDLPLSIDPRYIGVVPVKPTARRLVYRIGLLAP